jgi:DNA (cytosine-5)-methyltransferase 1
VPAAPREACGKLASSSSASTSSGSLIIAATVFIQMDVLEFLRQGLVDGSLADYALIWASPPCKFFTELKHSFEVKKHDIDLITPTRPLLEASGGPWVIENVMEARRALRNPILLCASMFPGLETATHQLRRHRLFEISFALKAPPARQHSGKGGKPTGQFTLMGLPLGTMTVDELSEAIPPAYSRYIAETWLKQTGAMREEKEEAAPPAAHRALEPPEPAPCVHLPVIAYCTTHAEAEALVKKVIQDAAGRCVALDVETAPTRFP